MRPFLALGLSLLASSPGVAPALDADPSADAGGSAGDERGAAERELRLVALVSSRAFLSYEGALWGGGLRAEQEHFESVGWTLDVLYERGEVAAPSGEFLVDTGTIGAGLFVYRRWSALSARAGAGVRAGLSRSAPTSEGLTGASSVAAPWGWPMITTSLCLSLGPSFVLELSGEGSYVVLPVRGGSGLRDSSLHGFWIGGQLGLGIVPGGASSPRRAEHARAARD